MKIWNRIKTGLRVAVIGMKEERPLTAAEKRLVARLIKERVIETSNGIYTCIEIALIFGERWSAHQWWKYELYEKFGASGVIDQFTPGLVGDAASMQNRLDFCDELIKKYGG